ncbi:MAG TPA: hypothetical protein VF937_10240 [Chloroflexota bacterium]
MSASDEEESEHWCIVLIVVGTHSIRRGAAQPCGVPPRPDE